MHKQNRYGFTIVELLIVVVVIGILAAITVVAYSGMQARARDSIRLQDAAAMRKALELYKVDKGTYPFAIANPGQEAWEASMDSGFMGSIKSFLPTAPVDPVNTTNHYYAYYRSPAGAYGCPTERGGFYVLRVVGLESTDGHDVSDLSACADSTTLSVSRKPNATQAVFFGFEN